MSESITVLFEPAGIKVPADVNDTLLDVAAKNNIQIRSDCGGLGVCEKCRVTAGPVEHLSEYTQAELDRLTPEQIEEGARLACMARVKGDLVVSIPEDLADSSEVRGKVLEGVYPSDPAIERMVVSNGKPSPDNGGVSVSMASTLSPTHGGGGNSHPAFKRPEALSQLSHMDLGTELTLVGHDHMGVTAVLKGKRPNSYGVAVDLGTTSIAAYLCDLKSGRVMASASCVNPQRRFGEDVISRITKANEHKGNLDILRKLAARGINFVMEKCLETIGAVHEDVDEIAVCGNTTMEQIFAGFHPRGLGVTPYLPVTTEFPFFTAAQLGLKANPGTPVMLMPVISGFVGGDTLSAILADNTYDRDEITLIVDIGTNGEVAIGNKNGIWVTSCATGPALEGAQISCGMRAVTGAIHKVGNRQGDGSALTYEILGEAEDVKPMGICGSGIIDAVAAMRRGDIILPNGRLNEARKDVIKDKKGLGREFILANGQDSANGKAVSITLKDIRQIQLAKAALIVGIERLIEKAGVKKIDRTILTGAFGARFNWRNAIDLGMFPGQILAGSVKSADNLAGVGVIKALLDKKLREKARALGDSVRFLELGGDPGFAMQFAKATGFPEITNSAHP